SWSQVYGQSLKVALTDTYGTTAFFRDFAQVAGGWGLRHDSGDPFEFAERAAKFWDVFKASPYDRRIVFSDNLTVAKCVQLQTYCNQLGVKPTFGIGTHFTNDFGWKPL